MHLIWSLSLWAKWDLSYSVQTSLILTLTLLIGFWVQGKDQKGSKSYRGKLLQSNLYNPLTESMCLRHWSSLLSNIRKWHKQLFAWHVMIWLLILHHPGLRCSKMWHIIRYLKAQSCFQLSYKVRLEISIWFESSWADRVCGSLTTWIQIEPLWIFLLATLRQHQLDSQLKGITGIGENW